MRSMDLPRGLLDRSSGQPGEPTGETDTRARTWVPDGRARPPGELLDNLRLRLSQLADNHPSAPRNRHARGDSGAPRDRDAPGDSDPPGDWEARRDSDAAGDWDAPQELDSWPGEGKAAERGIGSPDDAPDAEAGEFFGGLADAIRAASQLSDAFPATADAGMLGDVSLFANRGQAEPYRPWFMSGEPGMPWWAAGEAQ